MHDTTLGIRFDLSRLGPDSHGLAAWQVIWSAIDPAALGAARLLEGETAGTLARREAVFCVAIESDPAALDALRAALEASPAFARVAAAPPFADAATIEEEPLVAAGTVGEHGELEGRWPAAGLNAARERTPAMAGARPLVTAGAPASGVVTAPPPPAVETPPPPAPTVEEVPPPSFEGLPPPPTFEEPPAPTLLEGRPPPPTTEPPSGLRRGISRRGWMVIAAVGVVIAAALGFTLLGGGGGAGGPLASADEVEAQVLAMLEDTDLGLFGDPTVSSVTCPEALPDVTGEPFDCTVALSNDPEATIQVSFTDEDGTIVWCSLMSSGALSLNTEGLNDCGYFDDEGASGTTEQATTTERPETTTERPVTTTAPPVTAAPAAGTLSTAAGTLAIDDLWFTNEYPSGCEGSLDAQQCLTSPANRIAVLVLRVGAGQDTSVAMDAITDEAFQSEVEDESGLRTTANQLSTSSNRDTIDVVYAFLGVEEPTTVTLHWPGNGPVSISG